MIHTLGFIFFALVDLAFAHVTQPLALLYAVGLAAGCGLVLDGLIAFSRRWWPLTYGAAAALAAVICLPYTLQRSAHFSFEGRWVRVIIGLFVIGFAVGFPLLYAGARRLGRGKGRVLAAAAAIVITFANQHFFRSGYFASHAFISWASAILVGAMYSRPLPRKPSIAIAAFAFLAFAIPPPNHTRLELFRSPTALAPWVAAALRWNLPAAAPPPPSPWLASREQLPPRAPSPPLLEPQPIVILFVVDGLRWSLLEEPAYARQFPAYQRLKRTGVHFLNVHSPASSTVPAMATVFSGKYYSQLKWSLFGEGRLYGGFPVGDLSPRVPALLAQAGARTVKLGGIGFLANSYQVAPGFSDEILIPRDDHPGPGSELMSALLPVVKSPLSPLFVYVHFMDTHTPYHCPPGGDLFECYRTQVAAVDSYLGQLLDVIDQPLFARRTLLLFTADHGEAFGEHESGGHSTTIYEELLRVPLIVHGGGLLPRTVAEPVTLADLGPTLLDLFGQPTPAHFMGESLVGLLRGEAPVLTRPIFAEGRLRRAIVDGDHKVIVDLRRKTVEEYDLARDPGELQNLYPDARFAPALSTLSGFFDAHTLPGGPAYRP